MYILPKTTGGPPKKASLENEEDDGEDGENEQETGEDDTENRPVARREKRQEVHSWSWTRRPLDFDETVVEDPNLTATDKAVALSESVHSTFEQHLRRNRRSTVSNKNYTVWKSF